MDVIERTGDSGSGDRTAGSTDASQSIRILLVDDHADTLHVIRAVLEGRGYEVITAGGVAEAHAQALRGFDLLVCDIDLPDGTGIDLLERLNTAGDVRAIAMSGYGAAEDVARSMAVGFRRHLVKPFTADKLYEAVALALA